MRKAQVTVIVITTGLNINLIERLLQSLAQQTFKEFEVIIACETNGNVLQNLCQSILPSNRCIVIETGFWNRCRTANTAIMLAKGRYVALLEDDLVLDDKWFEFMLKSFGKYSKANVACVYSKVVNPLGSESLARYSQNKSLKFGMKIVHTLRVHTALAIKRIPVFSLAVLCKRDVLIKARMFDPRPEEPIVGEDYDLAIRIYKLGYKTITCPEALAYHYSRHAIKRIQNILRIGLKWWERLIMNEIFLFAKHIDILKFHVLAYAIYKSVFEPINVFIRLRTEFTKLLATWVYSIRGALVGLIRGALTKDLNPRR